jgi:fluoride exporter
MIWTLSQVALGGAIGSVLRYLSNVSAMRLFGSGFPVSTLFVNIAGSFLMGVLVSALAFKGGMRFAPFLMTGVLGGFTTFSAFSLDAVALWDRGQPLTAAGYVVASVGLSIFALALGSLLTRAVLT